MFNRNILQQLQAWKTSHYRKPLILRGARQVGKTTVIQQFSKSFDQYIYLNLEKPQDLKLFEHEYHIHDLVAAIHLEKRKSIHKGSKLIFIDEIQNSPTAVKMLRYFFEEKNDYFVIAAGSLLETIMDNKISFPVGRVQYMFMHPLSFAEFLEALEEKQLYTEYRTIPFNSIAHQNLLKLFHRYVLIGGMPEVVQRYIQINDIVGLKSIYESLKISYLNDVEKYATSKSMQQIIRSVINTAPFSAGERIKFQGFGSTNYRSREIGEALRTLEKAMLVTLSYPTTNTKLPIVPNFKKSPKLHLLDTGMINYFVDLQSSLIKVTDLGNFYKGKIIEHIVAQELVVVNQLKSRPLHFWVREKRSSNAEVDFVMQKETFIIPIEVKSGATGTLRSLHEFMDRTNHPYAIRLYAGEMRIDQIKTPHGKSFKLLNLPYFLAGMLTEYVDWFVKT